ncbi:hypothetical protein QTI66_18940 [Variovorax sp. J22R133]|uniref:hypothetical protein n=1 Tax=Variovorax brevis TaxID=3053503 RepID=UPI0025791ADE|nr:hypothetical protein [Variovorax sp. J22R133]MDM0114237.1 hypothetical protein [Variovorax sp. J22R133]
MMKASPGARSWIAAGVRHELLSRVLPALRHDMVGPVSVMRMALMTLKRQLTAPSIDAQACAQRVDLIENQIGELTAAMRSLRDWELATVDDGITRSALVAQCVALLRPAFSMREVDLQVGPSLEAAESEAQWPQGAALRYLLLCALSYLHDSAGKVAAIAIAGVGSDGLTLSTVARNGGAENVADDDSAHRAPRKLAIDAVAFQSLADDLGYEVMLEGANTVRFALAPAA